MKTLGAAELLDVWEMGLNQSILHRTVMLLTAACPEMEPAAVAELNIGARDTRLLQLREWLFGSHLVNTAACPQCKEQVEWESDIADLYVQRPDFSITTDDLSLQSEKYQLRFRLPNSIDIAAVLSDSKIGSEPEDLLKRCIVSAECAGKAFDKNRLPKRALDTLGRQIEKLDPQAEIRIELSCPQCSHHWNIIFDIASFLWSEINSWAERMLSAVHRLADAYGWSEREILELSPVRRQLYLGMVN